MKVLVHMQLELFVGTEFSALERAGWALAFVAVYHRKQFEQFLAEKDKGELSPEQLAHLKKVGLE